MSVDAEFARWLREGVKFATVDDATIAALWAELARVSEITSPLALEAGAEAEGERQIEFLGGPLAIDEHLLAGLRFDLFGKAVTLVVDRLDYTAGAVVFVIGVEELEETEQTKLTVVRKLT